MENIEKYVNVVENEIGLYKVSEFINVCKRLNNNKRNFLFVNSYQGKHVPITHNSLFLLVDKLVTKIKNNINKQEKVLIIGFAETATAVSNYIASQLPNCIYHLQTTRENCINEKAISSFNEEHSHAPNLMLYGDINKINECDRIIFVDDEITTGNTILNCIENLNKINSKLKYSVATILNWKNEEYSERYKNLGIDTYYVIKGHLKDLSAKVEINGKEEELIKKSSKELPEVINVYNYICNFASQRCGRIPIKNLEWYKKYLITEISNKTDFFNNLNKEENILILGTEEFMYEPMLIANFLGENGYNVLFHATTRSPIEVSDDENYVLNKRYRLKSVYDNNRTTYLYNLKYYEKIIIITDVEPNKEFLQNITDALISNDCNVDNIKVIVFNDAQNQKFKKQNLVKTTYSVEDVVILLKDITGQVQPLDTLEREKLNQSGTHYSEMLPLEYKPTEKYMEIYNETLEQMSNKTANATAVIAEKLYEKYDNKLVLVSLARAGTPIGILIKKYLKYKYNINVPHYSISIIRGKGIDVNAIEYIVNKHGIYGIQFVDGWIGKGAIINILKKACNTLKQGNSKYEGLDDSLAVLSDPAFLTDLCGTHEDFLIPNACLNSTISGLISRTFYRENIISKQDFHGAVYYEELINEDKSYEFINKVTNYFDKVDYNSFEDQNIVENNMTGIDEVNKIAKEFNISDINKIKPGVGETTRVLLRRVPYAVLVRNINDKEKFRHIFRLCEEKDIKIIEYPLKMYEVCGIIKEMSDL